VHSSREFVQHPTVIIVCTSADAQSAAAAWLRRAREQSTQGSVHVITIVALHLPFFVSDAMVMNRARPQVSPGDWGTTWIDVHGDAQRALGVADGSATPFVFTVDTSGRVLASVHATVEHPSARTIFTSVDPAQHAIVDRREPGE
jgi:hypothetical protein